MTAHSSKGKSLSMWERSLAAAMAEAGDGFWALLSDASVDPRGARSGMGAVLLDGEGRWQAEIQGKGQSPTRDTRLAEIWGIELGAQMALEKGVSSALVALCDCQPAVEALLWAREELARQATRQPGQSGPMESLLSAPKEAPQETMQAQAPARDEPSGPAKEAALRAAQALSAIGPWAVSWVPREKLSRANDLARAALGLRPENKTASEWSDSSWRPRAAAAQAATDSRAGNGEPEKEEGPETAAESARPRVRASRP